MIRVPVASDGWRFILPFLGFGTALVWLGRDWSVPLGWLGITAGAFSLYFFRDFNRATPADPLAIYSPGDGKVLDVSDHEGKRLIRIFLSVLDGHVQRAPVEGRVAKIAYKKGLFLDARNLRAHVENEQNAVTLETTRGSVVVTQIAGLIARRIVWWINEGQELKAGQRYGLIRFGSQVDVLLPPAAEPAVKVGDRVTGGLSVIARWNS